MRIYTNSSLFFNIVYRFNQSWVPYHSSRISNAAYVWTRFASLSRSRRSTVPGWQESHLATMSIGCAWSVPGSSFISTSHRGCARMSKSVFFARPHVIWLSSTQSRRIKKISCSCPSSRRKTILVFTHNSDALSWGIRTSWIAIYITRVSTGQPGVNVEPIIKWSILQNTISNVATTDNARAVRIGSISMQCWNTSKGIIIQSSARTVRRSTPFRPSQCTSRPVPCARSAVTFVTTMSCTAGWENT